MRIGEYTTAEDASAADWVIAGLRGFAESVLSVVPAGFAAYARIFHPAARLPPIPPSRVIDESEIQSVPWQEVAAANGRTAHRTMQWDCLVGAWEGVPGRQPLTEQPGIWDEEPQTGSLPRHLASDLAELLARYTTTPGECFFGLWEGWGGSVVPDDTASFHIPHRRMLLLTGPGTAVSTSLQGPEPIPHQAPNLWWPADRAWCVATEIDFNTTYLGASQGCVDAVLASSAFEAAAVEPTDGITVYSDTINPLPE